MYLIYLMVPFLPLLHISFPLLYLVHFIGRIMEIKEGVNESKFKNIEQWIKSSHNIDMYISMLMTGYKPNG